MVVDQLTSTEADRIFHALADATRRDILVQTGPGSEQSVSALARRYPISVTAVQKHVGVLQDAGLVTKARRGREQIVRIDTQALHTARLLLDQLEGLWRARMAQFGQVLGEQTKGDL
jgi:DNA-binding transcriptional ArsR family regulator